MCVSALLLLCLLLLRCLAASSFDRPVPELPSKADIERGRREREAEAKELARNEPTIGALAWVPMQPSRPAACVLEHPELAHLPVSSHATGLGDGAAPDERIAMALESKERGNQLVKAGTDMMAAKKAYDEGFVRLFFSKEEWNSMLGTEERAKVDAVKVCATHTAVLFLFFLLFFSHSTA